MFKNLKIANALLAFVLVFLSLVVSLGGLGYWSLNHINSDVQNLYRKSVQQSDAVNATTLSLLSARTDLVRYATRVTQDRRHENAAQLTAREHLASAEKSITSLEANLIESDKQLVAPFVEIYHKLSDNLMALSERDGQSTMQSISLYYSLFTTALIAALLLSLARNSSKHGRTGCDSQTECRQRTAG